MDTNQQSALLEQQMLDKSRLQTLRYAVLDMMEDIIAEDIMQVNLHTVQAKIDNITEASRVGQY